MEIQLRDGVALVDDEDADFAARFAWRSMRTKQGRVYAYAAIAGHTVYMHHLLLNHTPRGRGGGDIDHVNGDGLDNRRSNLRKATRRQNNGNQRAQFGKTSLFKGVSWNAKNGAWQAHLGVDGKSIGLGLYEAEEDAARAYDLAAVESFGEFARINFPDRLSEPAPSRYSAMTKPRAVAVPAEVATTSSYKQGATNPNAKLSEADVRRIIAELRAVPRRSQASIAAEFGVTQPMVSSIMRRKSWAHLWDSD